MLETICCDSEVEQSIQPGDRVILAEGPYLGTPGILLALTNDANWAEIQQWDAKVRHHPVAWLRRRP